MKRFLCTFLVLCMVPILSGADAFRDDFNTYAENVYGIAPVETLSESETFRAYASASCEIMTEPGQVTIIGESAEEVIAAACCALRCIDNEGSMIDQYGRTLHAYFLARSAMDEAEYRATTESGVLIFVCISAGFITIRLVK